jgi:hypothetical protein
MEEPGLPQKQELTDLRIALNMGEPRPAIVEQATVRPPRDRVIVPCEPALLIKRLPSRRVEQSLFTDPRASAARYLSQLCSRID